MKPCPFCGNARLIAAAPDMYRFVKKVEILAHYYLDSRFIGLLRDARELLARIDGVQGGAVMSEIKYPASEAEEHLQYYERQKQINHPDYYKSKNGDYEAIDFIEANSLNFNLGNVIKYIVRAGRKVGEDESTTLQKASWYLEREITRLKKLAASQIKPEITD